MCGRYAASRDAAEIAEVFGAEQLPEVDLPPRFNIPPTTEVYIVFDDAGTRAVGTARWGLIPSWSSDASRASKMINARSETVADKPAYRAAFRRRRCLVPADVYYEWQVNLVGGTRVKQPFFIHPADGGLLAMAGLFEDWQGPDGLVRSCTILTQEAVGRLAAIHDRMPVFLTHDHWSHWLDPSLGEVQSFLDEVLVENRSLIDGGHLLSSYPVSTRVNKPTNDDAALVQPVSPGATHEPMFEA